MQDVANYDMVCDIMLGDHVDHSKARIWNGNYPNHIVTFHESDALPFVFVIRQRFCWITTHYLPEPECRVGVRVWWHTKMQARDVENCDFWKPMTRGNASFYCSWNPTSSSAKTSLLINWYLYSLATCCALYASPTRISSYCHSHNAWCCQGKTKIHIQHCWKNKIPSWALCMLEHVCHVSQYQLWYYRQSM